MKTLQAKSKKILCPLRVFIIWVIKKLIWFMEFVLWIFSTTSTYDLDEDNQLRNMIALQKPPERPKYFTQSSETYDDVQTQMICSISQEIMIIPAILLNCGHSFEKSSIINWINIKKWCPICHRQIKKQQITQNQLLKQLIHLYEKRKNKYDKVMRKTSYL